jgi:glycosyltransferase involved in cell wall biosynthesis
MSGTYNAHPPTLCLCMIVKNEAKVIRRALESVLPHIDHWVICDTGSTDGTPGIIRSMLKDIPGELHHTAWKNFGYNRTEVISLAKGKSDYVLVMDADMVLNVKAPFRQKLEHDFYEIRYEGPMDYCQPMLVSSRHNWRYVGVTHEYIVADTAGPWDFLPEISLSHFGDGGSRSDKFERDIKLLTQGLLDEPDNERYMFYLAQSYRDLGQYAQALEWYSKRVTAGSWEE